MPQTSVGIMQCAVAKSGQLKINCIGVGVGVILYSPKKKIAAGLHVLAAHSSTPWPDNPVKYADTAIPHVVELLKKEGITPPFYVAIVGGATISGMPSETSIGSKVVEAVKGAIAAVHLGIRRMETGGSKIRSAIIDVETGKVDIT